MTILEPVVILTKSELEELVFKAVESGIEKYLTNSAKPTEDEKLVQIQDIAKLLKISISTLHSYKKSGKIPFLRIGRRVYFKPTEVLESLKKVN